MCLFLEYVDGQEFSDLINELETGPEELYRHIGRVVSKASSPSARRSA
jgi:hypothetical protein